MFCPIHLACSCTAHHVRDITLGSSVFTVEVRYIKAGVVAMHLKAETLTLARAKAKHMKAQAFHVEIKNAVGQVFPLNEEE